MADYVFGQFKDPLRLRGMPWWVRGVKRVQTHVQWAILAYTSILSTNKLRRNTLRNIIPYLA
jgi:hypothetical protein